MSQQINLFNPVFLKPKKLFSALTMAQALLAIGAGMAALSGYSLYRSAQAQKEADAIGIQSRKLQEQMVKIVDANKPIVADAALEAEVAKAQAAFDAKSRIRDFIQRGRPMGAHSHGEYLTALSHSVVPGVWLTRFSLRDAGSDIAIEGRALQPADVVAYVKALGRDEVFKGKSFEQIAIRTPQERSTAAVAAAANSAAQAGALEFALTTSNSTEASPEPTGEKTR